MMRLLLLTYVTLRVVTLPATTVVAFASTRSTTFTTPVHRRATPASTTTTALSVVSQKRQAVLDGAEWASVQNQLQLPPSLVGIMTVVTGTTIDEDNNGDNTKKTRVVGIEAPWGGRDDDDELLDAGAAAAAASTIVALSPDCYLYKNSIAKIPTRISDDVAISTFVAALAPIHCALPKASHVGGSNSEFSITNGKVVVVGGSEYACFVAR